MIECTKPIGREHPHNRLVPIKVQREAYEHWAFTGSGESAAAIFVAEIENAKAGSIILLDEPETSLHPRVQSRLLEFIAHNCVRKQLQVVIATHSIWIADRLPQAAIRVFEHDSTGRVTVSTSYSASEALHAIGASSFKKTIITEDERAKHLVLSVLQDRGPAAAKETEVTIREGGISNIYRDIQAYANAGRTDLFVVFDGDQRPDDPIPEPDDLPQGKRRLDKLIESLTSGNDKNGPSLSFVDANEMLRYIEYMRDYVRYLPGVTPESLVWSSSSILGLIERFHIEEFDERTLEAEPDYKKRIQVIADAIVGMNADGLFQQFASEFMKSDSDELKELQATVDYLRQA